jgi:hypothetical protein
LTKALASGILYVAAGVADAETAEVGTRRDRELGTA